MFHLPAPYPLPSPVPLGAHHHRPVPQEVEVTVLAEEVTLGVRGVELLTAHDEVVGKVAPWKENIETASAEEEDGASTRRWSGTKPPNRWLRGGFVPKVTLLGAFWVELARCQPLSRQRRRGSWPRSHPSWLPSACLSCPPHSRPASPCCQQSCPCPAATMAEARAEGAGMGRGWCRGPAPQHRLAQGLLHPAGFNGSRFTPRGFGCLPP